MYIDIFCTLSTKSAVGSKAVTPLSHLWLCRWYSVGRITSAREIEIKWFGQVFSEPAERNKTRKAQWQRYRDCACHCAFLEFFRQVVVQKSGSKVLRWSVGIEPTLKRRLTSSLSHFLELYGAASVAIMWFSIVLSLLLSMHEDVQLGTYRRHAWS